MEQTPWQLHLRSHSQNLSIIEEQLNIRLNRFTPFHSLFLDLVKTLDRFTSSLNSISDKVQEQILSSINQLEEPLAASFVNVRGAIVGIGQTWKQISARSRNQILEPLRIFQSNYRKLCIDGLTQLKKSLVTCTKGDEDVTKNRDAYYNCCDKLEKHKEGQAKIMMRIQNGDLLELQKFNRETKALLEKVSVSQRKYMDSVERLNQESQHAKRIVKRQSSGFCHNETSRVQFLRKIAEKQLKVFQLCNLTEPPQEANGSKGKIDTIGDNSFKETMELLEKWSEKKVKEKYVSYQELIKSKKQKEFQQQNPLIAQQFQKVKQTQKESLAHFTQAVLQMEPGVKLVSIQRPSRDAQVVFPPEWEHFRENMPFQQHYAFYFIHLISRTLAEMPNYYVKLSPPFYKHFKELLSTIINRLDLLGEAEKAEVSIFTVHQIIKISERVVEKQNGRKKSFGMKILSESIGELKKIREEKVLLKLIKYIAKKQKKKESKGVIGFTKGLFSSFTGKKEEAQISEEQKFNALTQMTHQMASLCLPTELTLPILRNSLKNNESSYNYLKDILLSKRDREQRNKLLPNKQTFEEEYKILMKGQVRDKAVFCLSLVSKKGFLNQEDIEIRLCCKKLQKVHLYIINKIPIEMAEKWKMVCNPEPAKKYGEWTDKKIEVEQVIELDVQRSLQIHHQCLNPEQFKSFLIFYARQHPKMPYCQGIHYIAGMVLLKTKEKNVAYSIFCQIIQKLLFPVLVKDFEGMPKKLYLIERVLAIFQPDIYDHLKKEMITPECFAVGWIITCFSSVYQYTHKSYIVEWFWERFVLWGWPQFYRLIVWLLEMHKDQLVGAGYDKCLQILGDVAKCPAILADSAQKLAQASSEDWLQSLENIVITDQLLENLGKQFTHV